MRPRSRHLVALIGLALVVALTSAGCGHRGDGLIKGKIDLGLTTTTGRLPCDAPKEAERAIAEASMTAARATAEEQAQVKAQFDRLSSSLPESLQPSVEILRQAFDDIWTRKVPSADPFSTLDYANADQAILRYVQDGCTTTTS